MTGGSSFLGLRSAGALLRAVSWAGFAAASAALVVAVLWANRTPPAATLRTSPRPLAALATTTPPRALPQDEALPELGGVKLAQLQRFALNVLLVPLLDDAPGLTWDKPHMLDPCVVSRHVWVDGEPPVAGAAVPDRDFALRFELHDCWPMGEQWLGFNGVLEMQVRHERRRLVAAVGPWRVVATDADGRLYSIAAPFVSFLDVDSSPARR